MPRDTVEPITSDEGWESHPAFATARVNRSSISGPGASLFDSEMRHQHVVTLSIGPAERKRDLNRDWIHPTGRLAHIEVQMSEAQWAALVSSFGNGAGVPVTVTATREDPSVPSIPYAPRMEHSIAETRGAVRKVFERVDAALAAVEEKPTKVNVRSLRIALDQAAGNVVFAENSVAEHVEGVVTKAKHDLEAMVARHAGHLGIDPANHTAALALPTGGSD